MGLGGGGGDCGGGNHRRREWIVWPTSSWRTARTGRRVGKRRQRRRRIVRVVGVEGIVEPRGQAIVPPATIPTCPTRMRRRTGPNPTWGTDR